MRIEKNKQIGDCRNCKFVEHKETNKKLSYGHCKTTDLLLITVQNNCPSYAEYEQEA